MGARHRLRAAPTAAPAPAQRAAERAQSPLPASKQYAGSGPADTGGQRTAPASYGAAGNRAFLRWLQRGDAPGPQGPQRGNLQAKPQLDSQAGDALEQEADEVAAAVVAAPNAAAPAAAMPGVVQPTIGRAGWPAGGDALDAGTRAFMEPRLGVDLSAVRVHTGDDAAAATRAVAAQAFTTGPDIVFAPGRYQPGTRDGRTLLAHELAHVMQQGQRGGALQRKPEPGAKAGTGICTGTDALRALDKMPSLARIEAFTRETGAVRATLSDGSRAWVQVLDNSLVAGDYTVSALAAPEGPKDAEYLQRWSKGFGWRQLAAQYQGGDVVQLHITPLADERFARLPAHIKAYLLTGGLQGSRLDLAALADEGEALVRAGITAPDLALASDPGSVIEVRGEAPPETDIVESLRRRGFSDFPSRDEYHRRLAWMLVESSDFRRWWTKADLEAYWRTFPDEARSDWDAFADQRYHEAKQAEAAAWIEAFRRIDAAAGVANAIAVVTVFVAGGFAGAEILALPAIPALPATIQGVQTAVWAKTLFAAGLSASYLEHVVQRSEEAAAHGGANPLSIVSAAVLDTSGVGSVAQSANNKSLLTGEDLKLSGTERGVGAFMGAANFVMNVFGVKDLIAPSTPLPSPRSTPGSAATGRPPPEPQPPALPAAAGDGQQALALSAESPTAVAPWTADELARLQEQGIASLSDVRAAQAARAEQALQADQAARAMQQDLANAQAQPMAASASAGGGGRGVGGRPALGNRPATGAGSVPAGTRQTVFRRIGPPSGPRPPARPPVRPNLAEVDEADDLLSSLAQLKQRDPGGEASLIENEFAPENVRQPGNYTPGEYDPAVGDSTLLGERMTASGSPRPTAARQQAHHMIPSNEPRAVQVRDFVRRHGFSDINDPDNGVWLPTGKRAPNTEAGFKHEFTFDNAQFNDEYFQRLEDLFMKEGITEDGIRARLNLLRDSLLDGRLPAPDADAGMPL